MIFALGIASSPVHAGPNEGGILILHASPDLPVCVDAPPCEWAPELRPLDRCIDALTNLPGSGGARPMIAYAAFAETSAPRVAGVTFGIDYDDTTVFLTAFEGCADFELSTGGWPAPGEGTAVTWSTPQTEPLQLIYAFHAYEYYGVDTSFDLVPHPTQGGNFADDDIPSTLDAIVDFGSVGFSNDPGYLPPCPVGEPVGACCLCGTGGNCVPLTRSECDDIPNAEYQGDDVPCDPSPCDCSGACCLEDGSCEIRFEFDCPTGEFFVNTSCDDVDCGLVPTLEQSWGRIKRQYR